MTIQNLIHAIIAGVVFYVVYILIGMVVTALGLPAIIMTLIAVLLLLAFILYLIRLFGINF